MMNDRRRALGKSLEDLGISDLLGSISKPASHEKEKIKACSLDVTKVRPNPYQPRKHFSAKALEELAQSIKSQGLLQPIVVRKVGENYELIAGERRLRASQIAGFTMIPAVIKDISDQACLVLAVIENIQRQDLNVIELAESFHSLAAKYGMTHAEVGKIVGKSRASVSNLIRLLQLDDGVKGFLIEGLIEMGHARCMLSLPACDQVAVAQKIIDAQLPVRDAESLVRSILSKESEENKTKSMDIEVSKGVIVIGEKISSFLGTKVMIKQKPNQDGGVVTFQYSSEKELLDLYGKMALGSEKEAEKA